MSTLVSKVGATAVQKSLEEARKVAKPLESEKSFGEIMKETENGMDFARSLGMSPGQEEAPIETLNVIDGDDVAFKGSDLNYDSKGDASRKLVDIVGEVNKGQMQMDDLVNHVLYSGKKFSNQELLVIQAHVFHYAQMTEMTVKVAEQGVNSVKTVLNTQVQ